MVKREGFSNALAHEQRLANQDILPAQSCRRAVRSEELLKGGDGAVIDHNGKLYLLRCLPSGRLILTGWDARQDGSTRRNSLR